MKGFGLAKLGIVIAGVGGVVARGGVLCVGEVACSCTLEVTGGDAEPLDSEKDFLLEQTWCNLPGRFAPLFPAWNLLSRCRFLAAKGHPESDRWLCRFPLTWPLPVHPGVGHLTVFSCIAKTESSTWKKVVDEGARLRSTDGKEEKFGSTLKTFSIRLEPGPIRAHCYHLRIDLHSFGIRSRCGHPDIDRWWLK